MARTPLMRALQRMASEHTEASEKRISVEEERHLRRATISRRDLLKGAAALAAGLALSDPLSLAEHMLKVAASSPPRLAIAGTRTPVPQAAPPLQHPRRGRASS